MTDNSRRLLTRLWCFDKSTATKSIVGRLASLLRHAEAEAMSNTQPAPSAIAQRQFHPGSASLTAGDILDSCCETIDNAIRFEGLWNKPSEELGFADSIKLTRIYNSAVLLLGLQDHNEYRTIEIN